MFLLSNLSKEKGYVLLDALAGLCIFSFAFSLYYGLMESAEQQSIEAYNYMEAANIAQSTMEQLVHSAWNHSGMRESEFPPDHIQGRAGNFFWELYQTWEKAPSLLRVTVIVQWDVENDVKDYKLETLFYVE